MSGQDLKDTITLRVTGMTCGSCRSHVDRALRQVTGVEAVEVDLAGKQATVSYAPGSAAVEDIVAAVRGAGYEASFLARADTAQAGR